MAPSPPASTIHAEIGDVTHGSQVAVGNNILQIRQLHGDLVYVQAGIPAPPRLRAQPVSFRPRAFRGLLDRETETSITLIEVGARRSVECSGEAGTGKTSFLRHIAYQPGLETFGAGILYFQVNRQSTSDLLKSLFDAFYETDIPIKPTEIEIRRYLRDLNALILLDDVEGDEKSIESLMNVATECTFLSATAKRTLFGETQALTLRGLPNLDAVALFERELGRPLSATEKQVAERLCENLGCVPQRIQLAAHQARERKEFLEAIALLPVTTSADSLAVAEVETRSHDERKVLAALAVFAGAPVHAQHVGATADVPEAPKVLAALEERGLVASHNDRYMLSSVIGNALDDNLDPMRTRALTHFHAWSVKESQRPQRIADSAEPALLLVKWGMQAGLHQEAQGLAHAIQSSLALSGKWDMWADSLQALLTAGRAARDKREEAWALHQLGTRALCLGLLSEAKGLLQQALSIRESIGDVRGAEATRHNLRMFPAAAPKHEVETRRTSGSVRPAPPAPPPIPPPRSLWPIVAGVGLVAAIIVALILFRPHGGRPPDESETVGLDPVPTFRETVPSADTDTVRPANRVDSLTPPPRPRPQIVGFKADPGTIQSGEQAQLCFSLKDAIAVQIAGEIARRNVTSDSECIRVSPESSRSYTLSAFNDDGVVATRRTSIKVVVPDRDVPTPDTAATPLKHAQIIDFGVSSRTVTAGTSVSVCYEIANATRATLDPLQRVLTENSGCIPHTPNESTRYTLTVRGEDQLLEQRTADVAVIRPPRPARILSFTPSSTDVVAGTAVELCYEIADARTFSLKPSSRPLPADSGCVNHTPKGSTRYVLSATGEDNQPVQRALDVRVRPRESTTTDSLISQPTDPDRPGAVLITDLEIRVNQLRNVAICYRIENARSAFIDRQLGAVRLPFGCRPIEPRTPATYVLTAIGNDGRRVQRSVVYEPRTPAATIRILSFTPDTQTVQAGMPAQLCFEITGEGTATLLPGGGRITPPDSSCRRFTPSQTTVYTLTVQSVNGQIFADSSVVRVVKPSVILKGLDRRR